MKVFFRGLCLATMLISVNNAGAMQFRQSELPPEEQRDKSVLEVADPNSSTKFRNISFNQFQSFVNQCEEKYGKDGDIDTSDLNPEQVMNLSKTIANSVRENDMSKKTVAITAFFCPLSTRENPFDDPLAKTLMLCVQKDLISWVRNANWTGLFVLGVGRKASDNAETNYQNIMNKISEQKVSINEAFEVFLKNARHTGQKVRTELGNKSEEMTLKRMLINPTFQHEAVENSLKLLSTLMQLSKPRQQTNTTNATQNQSAENQNDNLNQPIEEEEDTKENAPNNEQSINECSIY